jgi:hypothetical protein
MKKNIIFVAMLAIVLILGLAFFSCDDGGGNDGGSGDGNTQGHIHVWGPWVVTTAPTATQSGVETRTCTLDSSHKETRTIPATGYNFQGTYTTTVSGITLTIVATGNTWEYYGYGALASKGTYTISGNTITAVVTDVYFGTDRPGDVIILTFTDENTIYDSSTGYTYRKVS